jgi:hypothetical protein
LPFKTPETAAKATACSDLKSSTVSELVCYSLEKIEAYNNIYIYTHNDMECESVGLHGSAQQQG